MFTQSFKVLSTITRTNRRCITSVLYKNYCYCRNNNKYKDQKDNKPFEKCEDINYLYKSNYIENNKYNCNNTSSISKYERGTSQLYTLLYEKISN